MRAALAAVALLAAAGTAMAEDARPKGHPASETSVPDAAPAADTKTVTGSRDQGQEQRQMNATEKGKVEKTGK